MTDPNGFEIKINSYGNPEVWVGDQLVATMPVARCGDEIYVDILPGESAEQAHTLYIANDSHPREKTRFDSPSREIRNCVVSSHGAPHVTSAVIVMADERLED